MKKLATIIGTLVLIGCVLTGCNGSNSVAGTWYSDRDDKSVLLLDKDGSYSDGEWLTNGKYSVEGSTIILTGTLDGQKQLTIKEESGKTVLIYDNADYPHSYYSSTEAAQTAREARQASEQAEADKVAAQELEALQGALIGYWYNMSGYPVEFSADGKYISYPQGERKESTYKAVDGKSISVTTDGAEQKLAVQVGTDGKLVLAAQNYIKAAPLALTLELLSGEWTDGTLTTVFTTEGTYIEKSAFSEFVADNTIPFTITGNNTIDVADNGGEQLAFLSETEAEYQLLISKLKSGVKYTVFMSKAK